MEKRELLAAAYRAFNARDIDAVLALTVPDVDWPNGMEGGRVHGHDAVRDYWRRQWLVVDPHVDPIGFEDEEAGRIVVDVHQVVRDPGGTIILDRLVQHVYSFRERLIERMDIREENEAQPN